MHSYTTPLSGCLTNERRKYKAWYAENSKADFKLFNNGTYLFAKEHRLSIANNLKEAKYELEKNKKRIKELDKLIEAVFEQNVLGKLPDDRYKRMLTNYENEQRNLMQKVEDAEKLINTAQQENIDVRNFLSNIRQCTDLKELTPSIVNKLIDKIEVFDRVRGEDGK